MSTTVEMLPITAIGTKDRLRHDDHGYVDAIAASVQRAAASGVGYEGLRSPIEVRKAGKGYRLISGLHRWFALNQLERETIAAVVLDVDEIEAKLLEVEENLVRRDLDALDRAFFVLRFREMFEAAYGAVSAGRPKSEDIENADENNSDKLSVFSEHAEERLGLNERNVQRCLRIANGLTADDIERLRGTRFARNQSALLAFAAVPPEKHEAILDALFDEESDVSTMGEAIDRVLGAKRDVNEADKWFLKFSSGFKKQTAKLQDRAIREMIVIVGPDRGRKVLADLEVAE